MSQYSKTYAVCDICSSETEKRERYSKRSIRVLEVRGPYQLDTDDHYEDLCDICMGKIEDLIESLKRDAYEPM